MRSHHGIQHAGLSAILHNLMVYLTPLVIGSFHTCHAELQGFGAIKFLTEQLLTSQLQDDCKLIDTFLHVDMVTADLCHHHEHDGGPTLVQKGNCADRGSPCDAASCSFTGP